MRSRLQAAFAGRRELSRLFSPLEEARPCGTTIVLRKQVVNYFRSSGLYNKRWSPALSCICIAYNILHTNRGRENAEQAAGLKPGYVSRKLHNCVGTPTRQETSLCARVSLVKARARKSLSLLEPSGTDFVQRRGKNARSWRRVSGRTFFWRQLK